MIIKIFFGGEVMATKAKGPYQRGTLDISSLQGVDSVFRLNVFQV